VTQRRRRRCLVLQHVPAEPPYQLGVDLRAGGLQLDVRRVFAGDDVPSDTTGTDGLVVLGGPMAAYSDGAFPTRGAELRLLADALRRGCPTLAICLGAQLLAVASGGEAAAGPRPEVGWGAVRLTAAAREDPLLFDLPDSVDVFHWHADTVRLPPSASLLASSELYLNQAFRIGAAAWGLQFHLELDEAGVEAFCAADAGDAAQAGTSVAQVMAATEGSLVRVAESRDRVFSRFAALVGAGAAD
jgi:GMP synthase-like glutamine amidotransferase